MNKEVYSYKEVKEKILKGLDIIANPVIQTLSPKGRNVLYSNEHGQPMVTNDGVTIARQINLKDSIEDLIVQAVKQAALATNQNAGDGTTTTVLLTQILTKEAFKLIDAGWNPMILKREIEKYANELLIKIEKLSSKIKTKKDLEYVANISANNDIEIAKNVVEVVEAAGENGSIIINDSNKETTEIIKEQGFLYKAGMAYPELSNQKGQFRAIYEDVRVLVTDKRIYYDTEALSIMETIKQAGFNDLVIVAREFIGKAPQVFVSNHVQGRMNILLIKDILAGDIYRDSLEDLADYLGCPLVSERRGDLTNKLTIDDFGTAKRIISDQRQTLIIGQKKNPLLDLRIKAIKKELDETTDQIDKNKLEKRLASLTNGVVTLKVGGKTMLEVMEKKFRYEDSINATKNAQKSGYVLGGGLTLLNAFSEMNTVDKDIENLFKTFCLSPIKQIAENCDEHLPTILAKIGKNVGYNALTGEYEDLYKAGVIEPFTVLEQAIKNAVSVSCAIFTSGYFMVNQKEEEHDNRKTNSI